MSATLTIHSLPESTWRDNDSKFDELCQFIELGQGNFSFALIEFDLPSLQKTTLSRLLKRFNQLNLVTIELAPPPSDLPKAYNVLDQLADHLKLLSPDRPPDAVIITGLEKLYPATGAVDKNQAADEMQRALQPLNLGRNQLKQMFPCPVALCLPPRAMAVFLRSAPDLVTWHSGFFNFKSDLEQVRADIAKATRVKTNWLAHWWLRLRRPEPNQLAAEAARLETLLADARALPADATTLAQLGVRLGWVSYALRDRLRAIATFEEACQQALGGRLKQTASTGLEKAKRLTPVRPDIPQERLEKLNRIFRGAAALTAEDERLYGREAELDQLIKRVTAAGTRFLIVWGETGCGKTSLVLAGLAPTLRRLGNYLPIIVYQWDDPQRNIRHALTEATQLDLSQESSLLDCVLRVERHTQKMPVVICDQFEQFFELHSQRSDRQRVLEAIGNCVKPTIIHCKFLFLVRADELGRLAEFDGEIPEPLEENKRFYLPYFNATDGERVLRQLKERATLEWSDGLMRAVVADLTRDNRVRPVELQLVAASLAASEITTEGGYGRAGRAPGLLDDYLQLMINELGATARAQDLLKTILLALIDEPPYRLTLTAQEITRRTKLELKEVEKALASLSSKHLVRQDESYSCSADKPYDTRYELTHDFLIEPVLRITRGLQDKRRLANKILRRASEDLVYDPRLTLGLRQWRLVRQHCDPNELKKPETIKLLKRSFIWWVTTRLIVPILIFLTTLTIIHNTSYQITTGQDFRVIIRRGIPFLDILTIIKNDTPLDTGYRRGSLRDSIGLLNPLSDQYTIYWEWNYRQCSTMLETWLIDRLDFQDQQGELLCKMGYVDRGIDILVNKALRDNNPYIRERADSVLLKVARISPSRIPGALLYAIEDKDEDVRRVAVSALSAFPNIDQSSADQIFLPLLRTLKSQDKITRKAAVGALGRVAQSDKSLAPQIIQRLLDTLKSDDRDIHEAASALGEIAQTDNLLAYQITQQLLDTPEDKNTRRSVASVLGEFVRANKSLAIPIIQPLINRLNDEDEYIRWAAADALGECVQVDKSIATRVAQPLLYVLNDKYRYARIAAAYSLGEVAQAEKTLATKIAQALLHRIKDRDENVRNAAVYALGKVVQTDGSLSITIVQPLINALKDKIWFVRQTAVSALGGIVKADKSLVIRMTLPLINTLSNENKDVRAAAASALGKVVQADKSFAPRIARSLIDRLNDEDKDVRAAAASALGEVAQADKSFAPRIVQLLFDMLKDKNEHRREVAAFTLGGIAQTDVTVRKKVFELLIDKDYYIRMGSGSSLANFFVYEAENEVSNNRDPLRFLFDHLEGRQSFMPNGNANTHAVYRNVVAMALANWLTSDKSEAEATRNPLRKRLEWMRDHEKRLHLRIAAWDALAKEAELKAQKAALPDKDD